MRSSRGVTLVEAAVGLALLGTAALVLVGLFRAGLTSFNYTARQVLVLSNARSALHGVGRRTGMLVASLNAASSLSLSSATAGLGLSDGGGLQYYVNGGVLLSSRTAGSPQEQAKAVTSLEVRYYNLDDAGLIMESTAAASALFVTGRLSMAGKGKEKSYEFVSGAGLRNHP